MLRNCLPRFPSCDRPFYILKLFSDTTNQIKQAALPDQGSAGRAYLVVLFDNQLDRVIKIIPSRSSRGKYFVDPRGFLMVNITIDSHDPFEKISFKAFDQDRATQILLNNSLNVELIPSEERGTVHKLTLTPQGMLFSHFSDISFEFDD